MNVTMELPVPCRVTWLSAADGVRWGCVDLSSVCNGQAISADDRRALGRFGYLQTVTFPAEEVPSSAEPIWLAGAMFLLPRSGGRDNIEAESQLIIFQPAAMITALAVLGASDTASFEDEFTVGTHQDEIRLTIGLTHFLADDPDGDNRLAWRGSHLHGSTRDIAELKPALWATIKNLPARVSIASLRLPYNPSFHVFGLTLVDRVSP